MTRKQKRLSIIAGLAVVVALAAGLILSALRDQIVFFYTPGELVAKAVPAGQPIRVGGMVKDGSWVKDGQANHFTISDGDTEVAATYVGILPDLFREGQGVIAEGALATDGQFVASTVLAKHDENYIPRELVDQLKADGEWRPEVVPAGAR